MISSSALNNSFSDSGGSIIYGVGTFLILAGSPCLLFGSNIFLKRHFSITGQVNSSQFFIRIQNAFFKQFPNPPLKAEPLKGGKRSSVSGVTINWNLFISIYNISIFICLDYFITSTPIYDLSTSGITTLPSFCW